MGCPKCGLDSDLDNDPAVAMKVALTATLTVARQCSGSGPDSDGDCEISAPNSDPDSGPG